MDELLSRGWLEEDSSSVDARRVRFLPTELGAVALAERGVLIPSGKAGKPVAFGCTDWTERRWHLGGALGRAIMHGLVDAGCIDRTVGSRVVRLTGWVDRWLDR